jgi:hypothetical protein
MHDWLTDSHADCSPRPEDSPTKAVGWWGRLTNNYRAVATSEESTTLPKTLDPKINTAPKAVVETNLDDEERQACWTLSAATPAKSKKDGHWYWLLYKISHFFSFPVLNICTYFKLLQSYTFTMYLDIIHICIECFKLYINGPVVCVLFWWWFVRGWDGGDAILELCPFIRSQNSFVRPKNSSSLDSHSLVLIDWVCVLFLLPDTVVAYFTAATLKAQIGFRPPTCQSLGASSTMYSRRSTTWGPQRRRYNY